VTESDCDFVGSLSMRVSMHGSLNVRLSVTVCARERECQCVSLRVRVKVCVRVPMFR